MGIPFLSKPIDIYKDTYLEALDEFQKEGINLSYDKSELNKNFKKFVSKIIELELNPKLGAKESTYWLIDNNEFIGRISIRHTLTPYLQKYDGNIGFEIRPTKRKLGYGSIILGLGIDKIKSIGIDKIFVMCKDNNIASIKIIEKNGGILLDRYYLKIDGKYNFIRKYIIIVIKYI